MFARIRRLCILAFVIAPVLVLGDAYGLHKLPAATPATSATATTTTTLASSNAPATTTIANNDLTTVSNQPETSTPELHDEVTTTTTTQTTTTAAAAASVGIGIGTTSAKTVEVSTTNLENDSLEKVAHDGSDGSSANNKQIKNANKLKDSAATTLKEEEKEEEEPEGEEAEGSASADDGLLDELPRTTNEQETSTATSLMEASARPGAAVAELAATTIASTSRIQVSDGSPTGAKLKNGLYRIKLAEIVTDEFSGLPTTTPMATADYAATDGTETPHSASNIENKTPDDAEAAAGKDDMLDLYPLPAENFNPITRDSHAKVLKERRLFTRTDEAEHRQNLLPNEVDAPQEHATFAQFPARNNKPKAVNRSANGNRGDTISDFTGKLLAEKDGVITDIEQKFQLNEFVATEASGGAAAAASTTESNPHTPSTTTKAPDSNRAKFSFNINHKIHAIGGHVFVERRVKKSFDFPMHRAASDVMALPHIDFANTKFNTDTNASPPQPANGAVTASGSAADGKTAASSAAAAHPEFSTTKFYNSKELYNEMLQHNKQKLKIAAGATTPTTTSTSTTTSSSAGSGSYAHQIEPSTTKSRFIVLQSQQLKSLMEKNRRFTQPSDPITPTTTTTVGSAAATAPIKLVTPAATAGAATARTTTTTIAPPAETTAAAVAPKKYEKELKRAKLLLKTMLLATHNPATKLKSATTKTTTTTTAAAKANTTTTVAENLQPSAGIDLTTDRRRTKPTADEHATTATTANVSEDNASKESATTASATAATGSTGQLFTTSALTSRQDVPPPSSPSLAAASTPEAAAGTFTTTTHAAALPQHHVTNPTKSSSKPIARPRILSRLQEKINSLECEIQNVPQDSHLWRGNETHELLLPILSTDHCLHAGSRDCSSSFVTWEGEAEIQSGDILIVEVNDTLLRSKDTDYANSAHTTQVYQVTRSGHEHCDVTEGILLDITPLVVDGRKLVTLYDKDLTEGVNLLIVVSELWGSQCVRLKVTTKTDNCGENADCSGKGVCYSNPAMEEYECQCCSGFAGPHCEEIDACTPSPCTNNGICVDLSQGHEGNSYQCLCPYGYTGKNCQYESDPCNPAECMNGGSCIGNSTHFRCDCTPGYTGPLCQHSLNECESSPCIHGICVDQEDGFRCFCQPGFSGELCNFEYNECESNPCQNGGECIDHIGSYECRCLKGYTGNRCQIKVDFCANKPCPGGHRCIDHGNDYSCECPGGGNGPDCNQMVRTQCNVNPCTHGGTCWSSGDSFYCACRPGFTGTMCEDEFVVETVVSSSEFMVDDTSTRNFNDKTFGSAVVLKSPIELHNAYFAAGVLAAAIFIVAIVVTTCHCKVNQTYRNFSTRSTSFFPILGFGRRPKSQHKLNKHWLSGKGLGSGGNPLRASSSLSASRGHLPATNQYATTGSQSLHSQQQAGQLHERPFQRHLAMNLENDMYYTVDFSENSQHSPLIQ